MLIVGEKINASIPSSKKIIQALDESSLIALAVKQVEAGADFIDINVGTGSGSVTDEINTMKWAVEKVQAHIDKPLCIDSADAEVLSAGLSTIKNEKCMINSTNAEKAQMDKVLHLAKTYDADLVALPIDEQGIPATVEKRIDVCRRILDASDKYRIPGNKILFDPLVLPISTDNRQGKVTLDTLAAIKRTFPESRTIMGLSNISYGLPQRKKINNSLMHMAIYAGLDAAIANPNDELLMETIKTAEAVAGKDRHCRRYIRVFRNKH